MSENWDADARVGVPMMQVIAKQVSQHKNSPREVRRIIDAQWLDEESKQQLRETFRVTDADLAVAEREAADQARRLTRERYGVPIPTGPCDCDAEFLVHPSGRIECQSCGAEWAAARSARSSTRSGWMRSRSSSCGRRSGSRTRTWPRRRARPEGARGGAGRDGRREAGRRRRRIRRRGRRARGQNGGNPASGRNPAQPAAGQAANGREGADPPAEGGQPPPRTGARPGQAREGQQAPGIRPARGHGRAGTGQAARDRGPRPGPQTRPRRARRRRRRLPGATNGIRPSSSAGNALPASGSSP